MKLFLKQVVPLLLMPLFIGCTFDPKSTTHLIQNQIVVYFHNLQVEGYQPFSNSDIDTIAIQRNKDGSIAVIIGEVTHRYRAFQGDSLQEHSQVFDVQIYEDGLVVIPQKENIVENEQNYIRI